VKKFIALLVLLAFVSSIVGCSRNITTNDANKDSLKLQMESDKFKFYSFDKDKKCINDLSKILNENYERISNDLKVSVKEKVDVEIYPDIQGYHNAIGAPNAPNWSVGTGWGNKIRMVSPLNPGGYHTYDTLMQVVVHEFTHIAEYNINSNLGSMPIWLSEGIAAYEAKQMSDDAKAAIKESLRKDEIPNFSEMNTNNFSEIGGYTFSYTAIEYIVKNYGFDSIISLIKNPNNLEAILTMKLVEFESKWKSYLKENYM
jgi:hypothetical protein